VGQKVNPIGLRVGITQGWQSNWYAEKGDFSKFLLADVRLRKHIFKKYPNYGISRVYIERKSEKSVKVTIYTSKPGIIIGRAGQDVDQLRKDLEKIEKRPVFVSVKEIKEFATNAKLIADTIAMQLEKRISFRRAMSQAVQRARRMGAKGVKVMVAGRLGGAEMSRTQWEKDGRIPLHTQAHMERVAVEARTLVAFRDVGEAVRCLEVKFLVDFHAGLSVN